MNRSAELARSRRRLAREREAEELGQQGLFAEPSPRRVSNPPCTSRQAFTAVTTSGSRTNQKALLLEVLRGMPEPVTSYELAIAAGLDRHSPGRRLSDMEQEQLVRRRGIRACKITGRPSITWEAKN